MTDPLGQSQVLPYLKGLSKLGYEFHLISYEKSERFVKHKKLIQQLCDEDNIHWHPQYYASASGLKSTLRQVRKLQKVAIYLHEKHHFEIVHCRSYISALAGLKLKRRFGTKFVFDMRGFWADERVDGGLWNLSNRLYRTIYNYFKRKEKQFVAEADYIISLTDNGKNEILSWPTTEKSTSIQVIPCCANLNLFDRKNVDASVQKRRKEELNISENHYVLGYVGSIGTWYMLPEMLDFFNVLRKKTPNALFLFVTGEAPETISHAAKEKDIPEDAIRVISVLHHEVPSMIDLMDASVFFIRPTYSKKASSPTKQGEIMAMGVPLVCNSNVGDTDGIVHTYNSGVVIEEFSDSAYENALSQLQGFNAEEIAKGAKEYFALEEGVRRYQSVYTSVLG